MIKSLYKRSKIKIKIGGKVSEEFMVLKGLRQGCCISPTLFRIYVDTILDQWKRKCGGMGFQLNNINLFILQFADDQVIIAQIKRT